MGKTATRATKALLVSQAILAQPVRKAQLASKVRLVLVSKDQTAKMGRRARKD
jgi:hypothetical protein